MTTRIPIEGPDPYEVVVGHDLLDELPALLGSAARVAILYPPTLRGAAESMGEILGDSGYSTHTVELPNGEEAKSLGVAEFCWEVLGQVGITRSDAIIGLGGGAVTDLAGFVAATWLRGVRVIHIPTTLLAMVDAAIGGKTAINTAAAKNQVGVIHPPAGVLCDLVTLGTLPQPELVSGLAEIIKCGFIADPAIITAIETTPAAAIDPTSPLLEELIVRAATVKAQIVSQDLHEAGLREILNYGHTLGHAIENQQKYQWRHGAAISVGMVFAAELARLSGILTSPSLVERHRAVLGMVGLPTTYRTTDWPGLISAMRMDKKARGNRLRFIVLEGLARPTLLEDPDPALVEAAYFAMAGITHPSPGQLAPKQLDEGR